MTQLSVEEKLKDIEKSIEHIKRNPTQALIDKTMNVVMQKLEDRDRIIDLELKNLSKEIKLDIQATLTQAHSHLEEKIDSKIKEVMTNQKEKVSWSLEVIRVVFLLVTFVLSMKLMGN